MLSFIKNIRLGIGCVKDTERTDGRHAYIFMIQENSLKVDV